MPYSLLRHLEWRRSTKTANLRRSTAAAYPKSRFHITGYRHEYRDSSVDRATRHGLGGSEIESWWRRDFPHPSQKLSWTSCRVGTGPLSRGEAVGAWRWPPTPSSAEVKERVKLYLYSPCGLPSHCIGFVWISEHSDHLFVHTKLSDWFL